MASTSALGGEGAGVKNGISSTNVIAITWSTTDSGPGPPARPSLAVEDDGEQLVGPPGRAFGTTRATT